jgi:zinc protease
VTAADVQRVLRKYVTGAHSVTIDYLPQAEDAAPAAAKGVAK